ncbi:MAG: alpha/beta fold hydrolase [Saprospiraceae bacterium]
MIEIPQIKSAYNAPFPMRSGHFNTIFTALLRKPDHPGYERQRITTSDDDFLDIDWIKTGSKKLAVLCHGLEGNSGSQYMLGMSKMLSEYGFEVACMNYRSCSGELNRQIKMYHSGASWDLEEVLRQIHVGYEEIFLCGFSLGGNLIMKYLGERGSGIPYPITAAASISVPADLKGSSIKIGQGFNRVYEQHFLISLARRMKKKTVQFPELRKMAELKKIKSLCDFDDVYTGPIHGFKDGNDYYEKCSAIRFMADIKVPLLLVNSLDDPFLSKSCYPFELANANKNITFLTPNYGGHVGFYTGFSRPCWQESLVKDFFIKGII